MRKVWVNTYELLIFLAFCGLVARVYILQVCRTDDYNESCKRLRKVVVGSAPRRGMIVDSRARVLAASNTEWNVFVDRTMYDRLVDEQIVKAPVPDLIKTDACRLAEILDNEESYCGTIFDSHPPGYIKIQDNISRRQFDTINESLRVKYKRQPQKSDLEPLYGAAIETVWKRYYPMGNLTSHVVGCLSVDGTSVLGGIEYRYNDQLQGQAGAETFHVDALRRPIAASMPETTFVHHGDNVILTLDATIQQYVRSALAKQLKAYQAESAVGIVMDPWTGAILALVSLPDYDPLTFHELGLERKQIDELLRNKALTDPFEPGSIFKPIVAAIALDCGAVSYTEKFDCEMGYFARYKIGEFGHHRFGAITVKKILQESSNIGMAKIGLKMGQRKLYDGLRMFGFGQKTGVDLPGEDAGLLWPLNKWSGWSVTRIPFGHEVSVTALQIVRAYSILANGGSLVTPHIVKATVDSQGHITNLRENTGGMGYIIKPDVAHWITAEALTAVVNDGTGKQAALEDYQVFGKTGTANISMPKGGYDTKNYVASFAGGAPAEKPAVVVLVSIRKPNRSLGKGYSGGRVAAPVVKDILQQTLPYLKSLN